MEDKTMTANKADEAEYRCNEIRERDETEKRD